MKDFNKCVALYREQLEKGEIQKAYEGLVKFLMNLKADMSKTYEDKYSFGNISPGYLDYTYFPFFDNFLRERKLRFGIVLNHQKTRFELWLMGQNSDVQQKYWDILKSTKWNEHQLSMPKYSVLEVILVDNPDFNDLKSLTLALESETIRHSEEITNWLKEHAAD